MAYSSSRSSPCPFPTRVARGGAAGGLGIATERDYLTRFAVYGEADADETPLIELTTASSAMVTVAAKTRVAECLSIMVAGGFRHLPVLGRDGKAVGVISMRDILRYFLGADK